MRDPVSEYEEEILEWTLSGSNHKVFSFRNSSKALLVNLREYLLKHGLSVEITTDQISNFLKHKMHQMKALEPKYLSPGPGVMGDKSIEAELTSSMPHFYDYYELNFRNREFVTRHEGAFVAGIQRNGTSIVDYTLRQNASTEQQSCSGERTNNEEVLTVISDGDSHDSSEEGSSFSAESTQLQTPISMQSSIQMQSQTVSNTSSDEVAEGQMQKVPRRNSRNVICLSRYSDEIGGTQAKRSRNKNAEVMGYKKRRTNYPVTSDEFLRQASITKNNFIRLLRKEGIVKHNNDMRFLKCTLNQVEPVYYTSLQVVATEFSCKLFDALVNNGRNLADFEDIFDMCDAAIAES